MPESTAINKLDTTAEEDKNIKMILSQCNNNCTYEKAKELLKETNGDVVNAIIKSMGIENKNKTKNSSVQELTHDQQKIAELRSILDEKDIIFRNKMSS